LTIKNNFGYNVFLWLQIKLYKDLVTWKYALASLSHVCIQEVHITLIWYGKVSITLKPLINILTSLMFIIIKIINP
jgi:hypothetical protein